VVDASVAVKWFIPEPHSGDSLRFLERDWSLLAPDLIFSEFGNILWKKLQKGEIKAIEARGIIADFMEVPIVIYPSTSLMGDAWSIAEKSLRSFYDSLYLALARIQGCPLVTADRKLYEALKNGPLRKNILWVENVPDRLFSF